MHRVTEAIEFCYGHRLLEHNGRCRYLHGHNGILEVDVEAEYLNDLGMVMDFSELRDIVKGWVDANIDHKMVLSRRDPAAPVLEELGEPVYLMDENPTAENLSKHIYEGAREQGVLVTEVRLWETPSSYSVYREP